MITNITSAVFTSLAVKNGEKVKVTIQDKVTIHTYFDDINTAPVGRGDYVVVFNETPALWIVKAYIGIKNELTVSEGSPLLISRHEQEQKVQPEGESNEGQQ